MCVVWTRVISYFSYNFTVTFMIRMHRITSLMAVASILTLSASRAGHAQAQGAVVPGVEVLLSDSLHLVAGKRVGLLTNHSGRDRKGTSTIDLLFTAPGVKLTSLFGPEHGIRGEAKAG